MDIDKIKLNWEDASMRISYQIFYSISVFILLRRDISICVRTKIKTKDHEKYFLCIN